MLLGGIGRERLMDLINNFCYSGDSITGQFFLIQVSRLVS